jgi:hypothetical protein
MEELIKKKVTPTDSTYSSLIYAFDFFNQVLFDSTLPSVVFSYHRQNRVMGYASFERWVDNDNLFIDELAINPEYFAKYPLIEICQTLVHEMVHIWQAHHGEPSRRNYHNTQWSNKMQSIGLMPSSTGLPGGKTTGELMMDYVMINGAFLDSCRQLKKQGFHIPLVDRFPIFRVEQPILAYDEKGTAYELTKIYNIKKAIQTDTTPMKSDKGAPLSYAAFDSSVSLGQEADADAVLNSFLIPTSTRPKSKSGRVKYCCPSCQSLLWAKPGLNIGCLDCEQKFSQTE